MAVSNVVKTPISGSSLTTSTGADKRIVTYRLDEVFHIEPYKTPLLALLQRIGIESCPNNKVEWLERGRMQRTGQLGANATWSTGADGEEIEVTVVDRSVFMVDQLIYCVDANGGDSGTWVARVTSTDSADVTKMSIARVLSDTATAAPNVTANDKAELLVIGYAGEEGSSKPASLHIQPDNEYTYIQEFRSTWNISKQMQATDVYGQPEAQALAMETMGVHRMDLERAAWFGVRNKQAANENDNTRWYTDGVLNRIQTNNQLATGDVHDLTYDLMVTQLQPLYELNPGQTLFGFCGPAILNRVSTLTWQGGTAGAQSSNTRPLMDEVFGIRVAEVHTPHGILKLIPHYEVFRRRATLDTPPTNMLSLQFVVLDLDEVRGCTLAGHGLGVVEENIQSPGDHVRIDGITSDFGLMLKHEAKHGKYAFTGV